MAHLSTSASDDVRSQDLGEMPHPPSRRANRDANSRSSRCPRGWSTGATGPDPRLRWLRTTLHGDRPSKLTNRLERTNRELEVGCQGRPPHCVTWLAACKLVGTMPRLAPARWRQTSPSILPAPWRHPLQVVEGCLVATLRLGLRNGNQLCCAFHIDLLQTTL